MLLRVISQVFGKASHCILGGNVSNINHQNGCHFPSSFRLTHWGRVTHICVGNLTIIGSDNGLSPGRRQAITWTNVGILLIGPLGTNFSEMLIEILTFSFNKIHLKMSSAKWRPFCLGLNVLSHPNSTYRSHPHCRLFLDHAAPSPTFDTHHQKRTCHRNWCRVWHPPASRAIRRDDNEVASSVEQWAYEAGKCIQPLEEKIQFVLNSGYTYINTVTTRFPILS